jgi:hypothetical protein
LLKVALNKPSSFSSTGLVFQYRSLTWFRIKYIL